MRREKQSEQTRIGLFGGTFDPVHYGHLRAAEEILETFALSRVEFIPSRVPPHKTGRVISPAEDRVAMLRLAVEGNPGFRVSEVEISRPGPSYLVETLETYRKEGGGGSALYFLMGMDSYREIATWHRYEELFGLADFVVITRPGYPRPTLEEILPPEVAASFVGHGEDTGGLLHRSGHRVHFEETTLLDISASRIRRRVRENRSIRYLVPAPVRVYIGRRGLYTT